MNVTDLAIGLLADFIDVLLDPCPIVKGRLISDRHHGNVASAVIRGFGINPQDHLFVGCANKGIVDIRQGRYRNAVHGQDVITRLQVDADRSQRRAGQFSPGKIFSIL